MPTATAGTRSATEVLWAHLDAIASQMQATLLRTAFSAGIRAAGDCSCALFDRRGRLITQASTAPGQLGSMPFLIADFRALVDEDDIREGDVFITNDPWLGCGHTPDIYVIAPVFEAGRLLAYACISGHHSDVGGLLGSHYSTEVYEEGLQIPISHLVDRGVENAELFALLRANSRRPEELAGDLRAQMSGTAVAQRELLRISERFGLGPAELEQVTSEILDRSEAAVRTAIRAIPDGRYTGQLPLDDRCADGERLIIRATVTVTDDELEVDFEGTSAQVAYPINSVLNYARAYVFTGIKMAIAPGVPSNAGAIAPITTVAPERTIVNAAHPAPVRWRTTVGLMIPDVLFAALTPAIPDRVLAGNGTVPRWHEVLYSRTGGADFIVHCHYMGGMGARASGDGLSAIAWPANINEIPVELIEHDSPLRIERKAYRADSGGAGRFRGGLGQEVVFRNPSTWRDGPAQPVVVGLNSGRIIDGARGLDGGLPGLPGEVTVGGQAVPSSRGEVDLRPGQTLVLRTPGGGGFGPPEERDRGRVQRDLRAGLISAEVARSTYGLAPGAAPTPGRPA